MCLARKITIPTNQKTVAVPPTDMLLDAVKGMDTNTNTTANAMTGRKRPRQDDSSSASSSVVSPIKSVKFAPAHEVLGTVSSCADMSDLEKAIIWYPTSDLDAMKESARDAGRRLRTRELRGASSSTNSTSTNSDYSDGDEDEETTFTTRGLEHRTSLERQRNKYVALRAVLECHRRLRSPTTNAVPQSCGVDPTVHLALVSAKVTRWSREVALATGQSDFLASYPMLRKVVPAPPTVEEISRVHPFPLALRRRSSFGGGQAGRLSPAAEITMASNDDEGGEASSGGTSTPPPPPPSTLPAVVSPLSSPVTLSPVSLSAVPVTVEEDEDSDDEARRRMAKRQRRTSLPLP